MRAAWTQIARAFERETEFGVFYDARHGVYDRVLVMNGDRLARDAEGLAAIGEKLTAAGVRVYCPDGEIDLAPAYSHGYFRVATMEQTM